MTHSRALCDCIYLFIYLFLLLDDFMEEKAPVISPYGETFICDNTKDAQVS